MSNYFCSWLIIENNDNYGSFQIENVKYFLSSVFEFDQSPLIIGAKALIKKYMSGFWIVIIVLIALKVCLWLVK